MLTGWQCDAKLVYESTDLTAVGILCTLHIRPLVNTIGQETSTTRGRKSANLLQLPLQLLCSFLQPFRFLLSQVGLTLQQPALYSQCVSLVLAHHDCC